MPRLALIAALATCLTGGTLQADEVVVFAAASLKTALDRIADDFSAATGHRVTLSYAGSNQLALQILQGAPADIFISADEDWMDAVQDDGLLVPASRTDLLGNRLALIGPAGATPLTIAQATDLAGYLGDERLAMALVDAVPAGRYGRAALDSLGLWDQLASMVVQTENVRGALTLVAQGEAMLGIVYVTDALAEPGVALLSLFPEDSHPPIRYPVALLTNAADAADRAFLDALNAAPADAVFAAAGFIVLD